MYQVKFVAYYKCGHSHEIMTAKLQRTFAISELISGIEYDDPNIARITVDIALPERDEDFGDILTESESTTH